MEDPIDIMDCYNERAKLHRLKNRYFRPVISYEGGILCHHADCSIYRSIEHYGTAACTCGFLHDLRVLACGIRSKLWPIFYDELRLEDGPNKVSEAERKEISKLLEQVFGPMDESVDLQQEEEDWSLIEEFFGKTFRETKEKEIGALSVE